MQTEQAPTPGVSSRRSACDRCRGQKLRCLREGADPDGRCDRCSKADAQCVTSPVYHMRNYSVVGDYVTTASPSNKRRRRADPGSRDTVEAPTPRQQSQGQTPPSAASEPTSAPFEWPSVDPFVPPPANDGNSTTNFGTINWNSLMDPVSAPLTGSTPVAQAMPWPSYSEEPLRTPSLANLGSLDLGIPNGESAASVGSDTMQCHTEELSRINLDLATQMVRMAKGPPHINLKTLIAPDCGKTNPSGAITTPLEDLLTTTRHYLDVLGLVAGMSRPWLPTTLNPPPPSGPGVNPGLYVSASRSSSTSSSASTSASSTASQEEDSWSAESPATSTQPSSVGGPQPQVDTSALLLVLTCYIHILRLHVALFAHIREYLQLVSESDDRTINPLPGLCGFDNFPLQSGNLQATMIIHLVTNMFERIESLLGLPRELRIGNREVGHDGLLRSEGFLRLAESLIHREDTGRPEEGKGGIKSLQRDMKKAKRLLRGRIAP